MNSYSLDLTGNVYLLILFLLIAFGLSLYTYTKTNPPISARVKYFLMFLRTLSLALLLIMIFQPILTRISSTQKEPKVAVIIDKSKSMTAEDASGNRKEILDNIFANPVFNDFDEENSIFALFDMEMDFIEKPDFDTLDFKGDYTDISLPIRNITNISEEENIRSILLITDGAFNTGSNPIYDSEKFGKPIDIIAIGDTNRPRDIKLTSMLTNEIAFKDAVIPVNINFDSEGFYGDSLEISLYADSELVEQQNIQLRENQSKYSTFFKFKPEYTGNVKLNAIATPKEGEITLNNNSVSEYIEVKDNKRVISIFSGYPYPDISHIKQVLTKHDAYEIREFIQKLNASFYEFPEDKDFNETDVFILIGFPIFSTPNDILNKVKTQLSRGKSVLFITGSDTDYSKLRLLEEYLPFNTASAQKREYSSRALFSPENLSDPLLKYDGKVLDIKILNELPPVFRSELFVTPKPESQILAKVIVNNVELNEPFLMKRNFQNKRSVAILSYGLYRWKLMQDTELDFFDNLINNTINWLNVSNIDKLVDFKTSKSFYSGNEEIEISAQVYDESLNPVDNADVELQIIDSLGQARDIQLASIGNGRYFSRINELPAGEYSFKGNAGFNNQSLGEDYGKFSVGEINIEYQNLTMNYNLLKNIADATRGKVYFPENTGNINELFLRNDFKPYPITIKKDNTLWNLPYILIVVIVLLGIEWIIRKRKGLI